MIILAHTGNDLPTAVPSEYGIVLPVRSYGATLYLAPQRLDGLDRSSPPPLDRWLTEDEERGLRPFYALRVLEYGLASLLSGLYARHSYLMDRSFLFDQNYASHRVFRLRGLPVADRASDEEPLFAIPPERRSRYVWFDRWNWSDPVFTSRDVVEGSPDRPMIRLPARTEKIKERATRIVAVSPELHLDVPPSFQQHWWRKYHRWHLWAICTRNYGEAAHFIEDEL